MQIPYFLKNFWQTKKKLILIGGGIIGVLLIAMVVVLLTSNTGKVNPQTEIPLEDVTIVWWKPDLNGMKESNYRDIIDLFEDKHDNVTIEFINKPYSDKYYQGIIEDMALGVGPDIFSIQNNDLPAYRSYLAPISVFQTQDEDGVGRLGKYRSEFADLVVRDTIVQDDVYGITSYVENMQMYINRDLLNQASIPLAPQTWDDLDIQIPKLTKKNVSGVGFDQSAISLGTGNVIGSIPNIDRHEDILPLLVFQKGGQMYDFIEEESVFGDKQGNSNPSLKAVEFYHSFADPSSSRYTWSVRSANNIEAFTSGQLAYILHYSYFGDVVESRNPRLNFEVAPTPQFDPSNRKTYGFFFMEVINRNLADKEENYAKKYWAEQFLLYLSGTEAQTILAADTGFPAARKDVINEQLKADRSKQIFAEGALYADNYYKPDVERTEEIWSDMMFDVHYSSDVDPEIAVKSAVREYERLVLDGPRRR